MYTYNLGSIWNYPFDISRVSFNSSKAVFRGGSFSAFPSRVVQGAYGTIEAIATGQNQLFSSTSPTRKKMVEEALSKKAYKPLVYFVWRWNVSRGGFTWVTMAKMLDGLLKGTPFAKNTKIFKTPDDFLSGEWDVRFAYVLRGVGLWLVILVSRVQGRDSLTQMLKYCFPRWHECRRVTEEFAMTEYGKFAPGKNEICFNGFEPTIMLSWWRGLNEKNF